ncbi:indole-3-glycerol phosphate synthase TrpC [Saccharibacillus sp. CPCC 101409]|uniref:indole-3-glycerol phosphate synthase TrpC n=1 Tax=Saccharibacillus sp. CPCC 101409 TaxID=3058041 RepID=UPI00267294D1|nr:indole-3-glycerol phosphate synthase TrpC [Saccharibacillus sp. CPCC 101409]MDO3409613.1 indole-3-glycerol phosphate synthase TrpC [Saccharibacillus sp. CPCC 101409]
MYLDRIVETKKKEVEALKRSLSIKEAERTISGMPDTLGFERALRSPNRPDMALIAEVKKASPSKGLIREDFHPVQLAFAYEQGGADCLSVLTDRDYFQGSPEYLTQIRAAVKLPILRKDFVIDESQIYEARLIGADAVLLIAAILPAARLRELKAAAEALGLDTLIEVHNAQELEAVLEVTDRGLIGVNNRNLHTFETSLEVTAELSALVPADALLISESAIRTAEDIAYVGENGARGVLIGETFMRRPDVRRAVEELMGPALPEAAQPRSASRRGGASL